MDKRKRIKVVVAGCFLLVCGTVWLGMHGKNRQMREIVQVKQEEQSNNEEMQTQPLFTPEPENETAETVPTEPMRYVHVCGAVENEGVYGLPAGSRVIDGIKAAGGFCEGADSAYHNLAAILTDGQKVYVPTTEETKALSVEERVKGNGTASHGEAGAGAQKRPVNINTADTEELMTLSGIGKSKAEAILRYREKVGPFQKIEEIKNVSGIGDAMFEQIKDSIVAE